MRLLCRLLLAALCFALLVESRKHRRRRWAAGELEVRRQPQPSHIYKKNHDLTKTRKGKTEQLLRVDDHDFTMRPAFGGDSVYALMSWLITPLRHPRTNAERNFNRSHVSTRNTIEHAFGLLKSRFRCLHVSGGALLYDPDFCCRIITTCAALHNICVRHNIPLPEPEVPDPSDDDEQQGQQPPPEEENPGQHAAGQSIRDTLINNLFTRL